MAEVTEIKIDNNIPIPLVRGKSKYPFAKLEIGESFFVPEKSTNFLGAIRAKFARILSRKFIIRSVTENGVKGIRVWRVS